MFKWACLGLAAVAVLGLGWMINDVRLELRQTTATLNQHLPAILEKAQKSTDTLNANLPDIVEKTRKSTGALAELADDVRQLKNLAGLSAPARDKNLAAYAGRVLDFLQASDGTIGAKKLVGRGLSDPLPAKDWVAKNRFRALTLLAFCGSRDEFVTKLGDTLLGTHWYYQNDTGELVRLADWIRANHPESKDVKK